MQAKILLLNGSPRVNGNTSALLAALSRGAESAGAGVEHVRVASLKMSGCIACGACDHSGVCVLEDDMSHLYDKIVSADRLVLASPVYFYSVSSQLKMVIDRCQALWNRKIITQKQGQGLPEAKPAMLLLVAATKGAKVFSGIELTARYAFQSMGYACVDQLCLRGIENEGDALACPDLLAMAEAKGAALAK